ncbi:hypothetical protein niasHT_007332 [Heterodera trifolii]|uniref:Mss4-like protein n=1 Tax=Heterodera trifolii TaxID=157864 RepID=A0ABD2LLC7_9BILA
MSSNTPQNQPTPFDCSAVVHSLKNLLQLNKAVQNILESTDKAQPELFGRINQVTNSLRSLRESVGQIEDIDRIGTEKGQQQTEFSREEEVTADGRNIRPVLCPHCPSVILRPLSAQFLSSTDGPRIALPLPRQKKRADEGGDEAVQTTEHSQWWTLTDMMQFENVGFTNAFRGRRFLACADCEIGPIGFVCDQTGKFLVSVERVRHK